MLSLVGYCYNCTNWNTTLIYKDSQNVGKMTDERKKNVMQILRMNRYA